MPQINFRISRKHARMLALLGAGWEHTKGAPLKSTPEEVLQELLERLDDGVFRPGSWEREVVRRLFGDAWDPELEEDPSAPYRLRLMPLGLCADLVPGEPGAVIVYRFAVPNEVEDQPDANTEIEIMETDDGLTHARLASDKPLAPKLVFHVHRNFPELAAWFNADAAAEPGPSPEVSAETLEQWRQLCDWHVWVDRHEVEDVGVGLPPAPERDLRGDARWA